MMDQLAAIYQFSQKVLAADRTGHDFAHTLRVMKWVETIIEQDELPADIFIAKSAALLHDTIDDKVVDNVQLAREELDVFLTSLVTIAQKNAIFQILDTMSFSANLEKKKPLSLEGKIVQDADRLDALGAQGILRTAYFGGAHGHPIYDPAMKVQTFQTKEQYRQGTTVINHFYEKLLLLPDQLHTQTATKEGQRRLVFMQEFLKEFYQEVRL